MDLMGGRVSLTPRPVRGRAPVLEAAMLGHLPGRVRLERLGPVAREAMRGVGFGEAVDHLDPLAATRLPETEIARLRALYHLPFPLLSGAELDDIFPDARGADTDYRSRLAGNRVWLPQAVDDYFANGGERLWLLRIPQAEGRDGFMPRSSDAPEPGVLVLVHPLGLRGLAALLVIPELAVISAPDLERLLVPARLADIPRVRLENPVPRFLPCGTGTQDDHRERRRFDEMPSAEEPAASMGIIDRIQSVLGRHRPDIQYLHSLPLIYSDAAGGPAPNGDVLAALAELRGSRQGAGLKRIQLLFPYLRGPGLPLTSPVGLVSGRQAGVARREGVWRSMAGQALISDANPYPEVGSCLVERLRNTPGVGVLIRRRGRLELEDERLLVPALHPDDYLGARDPSRFDGFRSAEVGRFIGFLLRRLRALGEILVFDLDPRDPRPRILLEDLFRGLHAAGALRGALPEEAFSIREGQRADGLIAYDIELAPAFPVDRLRLTFANREGEWRAGLLEPGFGLGVGRG